MFAETRKESVVVGFMCAGSVHYNYVQPVKGVRVAPKRLAHDTLDSIPRGRKLAVFLRNRQPQPRAAATVRAIQNGKELIATSFRFVEYLAESLRVQQTVGRAESLVVGPVRVFGSFAARCRASLVFPVGLVGLDYGVSRARPLARRCLRMRRPALVAIRARKPCVRARLRLLGWNVRFICLLPGCLNWGLHPKNEGGKGTRGAKTVNRITHASGDVGAFWPCGSVLQSVLDWPVFSIRSFGL